MARSRSTDATRRTTTRWYGDREHEVHKRDNGQPYHRKGEGNGYVLSFGGKRVYVAGDTEGTPEMKALKAIDVAFLPIRVGLPRQTSLSIHY